MIGTLKKLTLGIGLIAAASAVLLVSDLESRRSKAPRPLPLPTVALFQFSSTPLFDELRDGAVAALRESGFVDGQTVRIHFYNAESDLSTVNLIAKQLTDGSSQLVITFSTVCLQAVANANKKQRVPVRHVFGGVTDPFGAGVGINRDNPLDKPPYLTGMGTFQPVKEIFREAKRLKPDLKTVGVVWNPSESNSETCTLRAREVCAELGITLLEASIEKASDVREAAASLAGRGAQAFWSGGDATVNTAIDSLLTVAKKERIPLFSNIPGHAKNGGLFDLGADYYEVGHAVGLVAVRVLRGENPASIPVTNVLPERIILNQRTLDSLKEKWQFDADISRRAAMVIGSDGSEDLRKPR
jgi:putative tryptophan/tyrosine transport system substrate-binding protein